MSFVTSAFLSTLPHGLPTRSAEERQHFLGKVLRRHALRVGLCVFQQIFEVLVVDRFLELLKGFTKKEPCRKYRNILRCNTRHQTDIN